MSGVCGKCGVSLADSFEVVEVGEGHWHQRCALAHVIESMARLTTVEHPRPLLTAQEVGAQIGASASTVNRLARAGAIACIRFDRSDADSAQVRRMFRQEHVDEFLAAREHAADGEAVEAAVSPRRRKVKPLSAAQLQHSSLQPRSQRDLRRTGRR